MHRGRMSEEKSEYGWKYSEYEKKSRQRNCSSGLPSPRGRYSPQAVDELPNELNLLL